jgi:hypothetical protein
VKEVVENRELVLRVKELVRGRFGVNTAVVPYFREDGSQVIVEGIFVVKKDRGGQIINIARRLKMH